jgi:hypothetical protein
MELEKIKHSLFFLIQKHKLKIIKNKFFTISKPFLIHTQKYDGFIEFKYHHNHISGDGGCSYDPFKKIIIIHYIRYNDNNKKILLYGEDPDIIIEI